MTYNMFGGMLNLAQSDQSNPAPASLMERRSVMQLRQMASKRQEGISNASETSPAL